jgi:hypothetical protein
VAGEKSDFHLRSVANRFEVGGIGGSFKPTPDLSQITLQLDGLTGFFPDTGSGVLQDITKIFQGRVNGMDLSLWLRAALSSQFLPGFAPVTATPESIADTDGDGIADIIDNCPLVPNPDQRDTDGNGVGDACNDANDPDGDEFEGSLDNCPTVANPDQSDRDHDGIGDACDPFPDDPDNALAQCKADLSRLNDSDGDGIDDRHDRCPNTATGAAVDQEGCSIEQFCGAIDATTSRGRLICRRSDWRNDQPLMRPGIDGDCRVDLGALVRNPSDDRCVPAAH